VITGVGHESDFTIADFVADVRASTPTAAATIAAPDIAQWRAAADDQRLRLDELITWRIEQYETDLKYTAERLARVHPSSQIATERRNVEQAERALRRAATQFMTLQQERARATALRLDTLSPIKTLGRGYSIVRQAETNAVISSARQAEQARRLRIQFADGSVVAITSNTLTQRPEPRRARAPADVAVNQLSFLDVMEAPTEVAHAQDGSAIENGSRPRKGLTP
jgi:exodeoxyribonuclease VII large subunit